MRGDHCVVVSDPCSVREQFGLDACELVRFGHAPGEDTTQPVA